MTNLSRLLCLAVLGGSCWAGQAAEPLSPSRWPLLLNHLGGHHHPVTTRSAKAQRYFDQGLVQMWGFNHAEAIKSFQAAAELDADCLMAYWGVACAAGPNINAPMSQSGAVMAWEYLQKAVERKGKGSEQERDYVEALARRYEANPAEDRSGLDQAYADAMREVSRKYPDDLDAAVLFAEALMDTMPWDYWTEEREPRPATRELLATLRSVLRRNPLHAGANHFYIHAVEAGPEPEGGIPSADRLRDLVPEAGHLVHMPSHIYVRVGQYADASEANEKAIRADEEYIQACRAQGLYPGIYYPHNLHFLWFANCLEGRSADSLAAARKVAQYATSAVCGRIDVVEAPRLRHLPLLVLARFGRWQEILAESAPAPENVLDKAMWHYARGLAYLGLSQADAAAGESERLHELAVSEAAVKLDTDYLPTTKVLAVADAVLAAKVAGARGAVEKMIDGLKEAVAKEDDIPYMEPPYWYYPVRESLGAALLRAGQAAAAEKVFREDLDRLPRNGWGLLGLAESLRAQGKTAAADEVQRQFQAAWKRADVALDLAWF